MALGTASELIAAITSWLARAPDSEDSVVAQIPDFIRLAEVRFNKSLRVPENMFRAQAFVNEVRERLPANFLELVSLAYIDNTDTTHVLRYVSPHQFYMFDEFAGTPYYYTIVGPEISFGPFIEFDASIPEADLGFIELVYHAAFTPLDTTDDDATNSILVAYPDIYLFGSLLESQGYIVGTPQLFNRWTQMYGQAVNEANDRLWDATMASAAQERIGTGIPVV